MESNYGVLLRLVRRKLRDPELAADLVNEAVAISLEHLRSGKLAKADQGIAGYVFKVSMNLLRNYRRNKNNAAEVRSDYSALETIAVAPERDDSDDQRLKQLTREMLESLSMSRDRAIVERFYLDEEDKDSICRDLGVAQKAIEDDEARIGGDDVRTGVVRDELARALHENQAMLDGLAIAARGNEVFRQPEVVDEDRLALNAIGLLAAKVNRTPAPTISVLGVYDLRADSIPSRIFDREGQRPAYSRLKATYINLPSRWICSTIGAGRGKSGFRRGSGGGRHGVRAE